MIAILKPGLLTTIQDLGRPGYAHLGVPRSGALDAPALARANALVGNPRTAAGLETTLTGVTLRAESDAIVAVTGAAATVTVDGAEVDLDTAVPLRAGATLHVGPARAGVRSYLAFAGGITVPPVLGSRATDTLSGLGPPPMRAGYVIPIGRQCRHPAAGQPALFPAPQPAEPVTVRLHLGPRDDWFTAEAVQTLLEQPYVLSVKSNRVGARLSGPGLGRTVDRELPSEGIVLGAVQVPADGQPLIFLADHPTTGGYPVIGVVQRDDLPLIAQARPGTAVRFALPAGPPPPEPSPENGAALWT